MFSVETAKSGAGLPQRRFNRPQRVCNLPLPEDQLRLLVAVLGAEPGLVPVWNWQRNGVPPCPAGSQLCATPPAPTAAARK
jgi:hypothetical protein